MPVEVIGEDFAAFPGDRDSAQRSKAGKLRSSVASAFCDSLELTQLGCDPVQALGEMKALAQ
jgi:hypothetical protein